MLECKQERLVANSLNENRAESMAVPAPPWKSIWENGHQWAYRSTRDVCRVAGWISFVDGHAIAILVNLSKIIYSEPLLGREIYLDVPLLDIVMRLHDSASVKAVRGE